MSKYKYNFIYKTTCLITNKIYVGRHSSNTLDDGYIGNGVNNQKDADGRVQYFHNAVSKYGYENFKREILEFCKIGVLNERETFWIKKLDACKKDIGYNLTEKSCGGNLDCQGYNDRFSSLIVCPHCGKESYNKPMMINRHFDNCKENPNLDLALLREKKDKENEKRRLTNEAKPLLTCPYCGYQGKNAGVMVGKHFEKCKMKPGYVDERPDVICPHCGFIGKSVYMMGRLHFDNCTLSPLFTEEMAEKRKCPEYVKEVLRNIPYNPEKGEKISEKLKGVPKTKESIEKHKETKRNLPILTCPHCGFEGKGGNMTRDHFDNCKLNPDRIVKEIYKCEHCGFETENKSHYARSHGDKCKVFTGETIFPIITCPHCNKQSTNKKEMEDHHFDNCHMLKIDDTTKIYVCPHCNYKGVNLLLMQRHHFNNCKHAPHNLLILKDERKFFLNNKEILYVRFQQSVKLWRYIIRLSRRIQYKSPPIFTSSYPYEEMLNHIHLNYNPSIVIINEIKG